MAISRRSTANDILNRVAVEVGLQPVADPYASTDANFVQMQYFLNTAGEELLMAFPWEFLVRSHQITTVADGPSTFDLPADFASMIDQTGWERSQNVPLGGPLSAQDWTYLKGRDLASSTLYASFRIADGMFNLYPDPPPSGLDINFEYISTNWVTSSDSVKPGELIDEVQRGGDVPFFDRTLLTRMVKQKWLEAGGFESTKAAADTVQMFNFLTGKDKGSPILNAGRGARGMQYLDGLYNAPDTGFGL